MKAPQMIGPNRALSSQSTAVTHVQLLIQSPHKFPQPLRLQFPDEGVNRIVGGTDEDSVEVLQSGVSADAPSSAAYGSTDSG